MVGPPGVGQYYNFETSLPISGTVEARNLISGTWMEYVTYQPISEKLPSEGAWPGSSD